MKPRGKPIPGIFAAQDEAVHRALKKPVSGSYSMSTLVNFEPYVDTTMRVFCDQLEARFVKNSGDMSSPCDFGQWLQMFAFDVIGEMTFSRRLGFLETGEDVNHVMASIWNMFKQTSLVSKRQCSHDEGLQPLMASRSHKCLGWKSSGQTILFKGTCEGEGLAQEQHLQWPAFRKDESFRTPRKSMTGTSTTGIFFPDSWRSKQTTKVSPHGKTSITLRARLID